MTTTTRTGPSILFSFLLAGCAAHTTAAHIDEGRLARLPPDERTALVDQERASDVARVNLETAKVALSDAEKFKSIVANERAAAEERMKAARKAVELARSNDAVGGQPAPDAQKNLDLATQRRDTLAAKTEYAANLVDLRTKEVALREAELDQARADLELARFDRLSAHQQANEFKRNDFLAARDKAQGEVNERRKAVETSRSLVQANRRTWEDIRKQWNVAEQTAPDVAPEAPPPPQPIN